LSEYTETFLAEAAELARGLPVDTIDAIVDGLAAVREQGGRLFILGVGGGAGHASHAVNDFRKIAHLESYTPTDNVSELTARINDDGWESAYAAYLKGSRLSGQDAVLVFSVGGGSREHNVSTNLVAALDLARAVGARIYGIVGKADGETARVADACVVVPAPAERRTPQVEAFQAVVWHLVVSHPRLAAQAGKWESLE
jgi:D-sedoheptulose 7-phosphate isomerase